MASKILFEFEIRNWLNNSN